MNNQEFLKIRYYLGKTQMQISQLLGVSPRAVHSFEQGWRKIPTYVQRQLLFFLYLKSTSNKSNKPCWEIKNCPIGWRENCIAWEYKVGNLCWFINGIFCRGKYQDNWEKKIELCTQCKLFASIIPQNSRLT